eukprot:TRINITY_DN10007_c0_g1_i3.p1 TRINITY_DN10007_c0_g1~~TRINITY_DN10007_c0_g1_i3.p1  ORF type:complete len:327 (+),score=55.11 TRINITY_DN10007_c0_g1_i3:82-1062(+)
MINMDTQSAAIVIQRWWRCCERKRQFQAMKELIYQAEHLLAADLIRQLCPAEGELLKDPTVKAIVRLRFGGSYFPPRMYYKIFLDNRTTSVRFVNGRHIIKPMSKAAEEACDIMGEAKYELIVRHDAYLQARSEVVDDDEVVDQQDAAKLQSLRDELPASMGGRGNYWRPLYSKDLTNMGRLSEFVQHMESSMRTEFIFRTHRTVEEDKLARKRALKARAALNETAPVTGRFNQKSRQAKVDRMRAMYGLAHPEDLKVDAAARNHIEDENYYDSRPTTQPIPSPQETQTRDSSTTIRKAAVIDLARESDDEQDLVEWAVSLEDAML